MATKTIKLTSYTSVTLTYSITRTDTTETVTVTNIAWKNTRSGGLTAKEYWGVECYVMNKHAGRLATKSTTGSAAKGSKSWSKAVSWSWSIPKQHEAGYAYLMIDADMGTTSDRLDYSEFDTVDWDTPAKTSYSVTYNGNGSTGGSTSGQTKWHDEPLTLRANGYSRTGYTFYKWNTRADGTGTWYSASASYAGNAALTLYAIWNSVVTFDANGGTGAPAAATVQYGSSYTVPTTTPTRADHSFLGWATSASAAAKDDRYDPGDTFTPTGSITLYAVWKRLYRDPELSITACYRSDASGAPADEGSYVAVEATYSIFDTAAAGQAANSPSWLLSCNGRTTTTPASGGTALSGSATLVLAADLDTEVAYTATLTLSDVGGSSRAVSMSYRLGPAYYPIDVLGDGLLYQPTADTAVDASKTYYTRSGSGTEASPYRYSAVQYPVTAELPTYYEASGPKPGKGVAIGRPATHEGFDVGMPQYAYGARCYPMFVTSDISTFTPPTDCVVLETSTGKVYFKTV